MSIALYRKYRPQSFADVVGQDLVKKVLLNSIKKDNIAHAYLLSGPRGTGKTSLARLIAKSLNCLSPVNADSCNKCANCMSIQNGTFLDLVEIDAASNRGIEEIRQLKENVSFVPSKGKRKVYIIDEVHMLTKEAFNALLKTLEEPPKHVVFIMATTEVHKIPLTIISRVQRFDLKLASYEELKTKLSMIVEREKVEVEEEVYKKIFDLSGGSFRDSESILAKVLDIETKKDKKVNLEDLEDAMGLVSGSSVLHFVDLVIECNTQDTISYLEKLIADGYAIEQLVRDSIFEVRKRVRKSYETRSMDNIRNMIKLISGLSDVLSKLKDAAILSLPLEIFLYEYTLEVGKQDSNTKNTPRILPVNEQKGEKNLKTSPTYVPENVQSKSDEKVGVVDNKQKQLLEVEENDVNISKDDIKESWGAVLEKVKKLNHHLYAILATSEISNCKNGILEIHVAYKFHKQRIDSVRSRQILSGLLEEIYGAKLSIESIVDASLVKQVYETNKNDSNENLVEEIFEDI